MHRYLTPVGRVACLTVLQVAVASLVANHVSTNMVVFGECVMGCWQCMYVVSSSLAPNESCLHLLINMCIHYKFCGN